MQKKILIRHAFNLEVYTPKLWESLILAFCPLQKTTGSLGSIWFKNFADRLYIYKRELKGPVQLPVIFDGGRTQPWRN